MIDDNDLFSIWNWLPAFHAVAQTQHLPTAAAKSHVSASALSRMIKLIEARVGFQLFTRTAGRLELTERGRRWQAAVAEAVERLNQNYQRLVLPSAPTVLHVGSTGTVSQAILLPAIEELRRTHPVVVPTLQTCADRDAIALLTSGQLDYAILSTARTHARVQVDLIGELENGIFCGARHPLFGIAAENAGAILEHAFVEVVRTDAPDPWHRHPDRKIAMYVNQEDTALQQCLHGQLLAILPTSVAESHVQQRLLHRLPPADLLPTALYAAYPIKSVGDNRLESLGQALRQQVANLQRSDAVQIPRLVPSSASDDLIWRIGDTLLLRAEYPASVQAYAAAMRQIPRRERTPKVKAEYSIRMARVALHRGRFSEVARLCEQARAAAADDGILQAEAVALAAMGQCYAGNLADASKLVASAKKRLAQSQTARAADRSRAEAAVCRARGNVLMAQGESARAESEFRRGAGICERLGASWEHSIALFNVADALLTSGDLDEAAHLLERAARVKTEIGDRWGMSYVHHARSRIQLAKGQYGLCLREAAAGLELALGFSDLKLSAMLNVLVGRAHLGLHDEKSAAKAIGFALIAARKAKSRLDMVQALLCLVYCSLLGSDAKTASAYAQAALRRARAMDSNAATAAALLALAATRERQNRKAAASRLRRQAARLFPSGLPSTGPWSIVVVDAPPRQALPRVFQPAARSSGRSKRFAKK